MTYDWCPVYYRNNTSIFFLSSSNLSQKLETCIKAFTEPHFSYHSMLKLTKTGIIFNVYDLFISSFRPSAQNP